MNSPFEPDFCEFMSFMVTEEVGKGQERAV